MSYLSQFDRAALTDDEALARMQDLAPAVLTTLGGRLQSFDRESATVDMVFDAGDTLCHSGDIVQGGFVTGMLDAAMSHAVFMLEKENIVLPTLEIKVSFLDIARRGKLYASGTVIRLGKSIAFLEGRLHAADGRLLATATSTARVLRPTPPASRQADGLSD